MASIPLHEPRITKLQVQPRKWLPTGKNVSSFPWYFIKNISQNSLWTKNISIYPKGKGKLIGLSNDEKTY